MKYYKYQTDCETKVYSAWRIMRNVLLVLPPGGGKTLIFCKIASKHNGVSCLIVHRQELIAQISLTLASLGTRHTILAPDNVIKWVISLHIDKYSESFYRPNSRCVVSGVDTLISRHKALSDWSKTVTLWVADEAHHVLRANKWGRAVGPFTNARGLGATATPLRLDGAGLGAHADGVFDIIVEGPKPRELINAGFLTDYRIINPPSNLDLSTAKISPTTGDYTAPSMVASVRASNIIGCVAKHYLRFAKGKLGITYCRDVKTAGDVCKIYRDNGITSEIVTNKTPDRIRMEIMQRFRNGGIDNLVNVDLFGEGYDLPAIEAVSFLRRTLSFTLYCQQFFRAMRLLEGKTRAIIIDHVNNVSEHGLPDRAREWTLDRLEKKSTKKPEGVIPIKTCTECLSVYEAIYPACPYCANVNPITQRSDPKFVDGDLTELDPATLAAMRGEIDRIDTPVDVLRNKLSNTPMQGIAREGACKNHRLRQEAQGALRESMCWWAGHQKSLGRKTAEVNKRFYFNFGVDVMTAQTLSARKAYSLALLINKSIANEDTI